MPRVEFVDTSVLVNLLDVPFMNDRRTELLGEQRRKQAAGVQLILPVTSVIETGNHIAQVAEGGQRRSCAERFTNLLRLVADRESPWVLHEIAWDRALLRDLAQGGSTRTTLIEHAASKVGCGDLSILVERDRYRAGVAKGVAAGIWTLDEALAAWA